MKKLSQIKKKHKLSLGIIVFTIGLIGLAIPIIPGIVLITLAVVLLKDYFRPRIIGEAIDKTIDVTKEVVEDIGEEIEKTRRVRFKRLKKFVRKIFHKK